ncbi:hypothetical protein WJX77_007604 [Trebouxia sp. C0004]
MKAAQQNPRVVSLLPSATDIIAVAGGVDLLVGRSHECNWPSQVERLPVLTGAVNEFVDSKQMDDVVKASLDRGEGLYYLEQELLKNLQPDVILTQDLCNKLSDVLEDIHTVGKAVGREQQSRTAVSLLQQRVRDAQAAAQAALTGRQPVKVAFVEWLDPLFVGGHWTPEMITMAGGIHPLNMPIGGGGAGPSIRIPNQALIDADCDWIIVCPCGFTIKDTEKEQHLLSSKPWWQNLRAVQNGKVVIVDGNQMFARPGPRLVDALEFLVGLLHDKPELIPEDFPWSWWHAHADANINSTAHAPSSAGGGSVACTGNSPASSTPKQNGPVTHAKADQAQQEAQQAEQPHRQPDQPSWPGQQDKQEVQQRKWRAAPYLGPDIEEAHAAANEAGQTTYVDPATGYKVMTEQALRQQSVCCANRCRHCPYGHYKVPANRGNRINTITQATVLKTNRKDAQTGRFTLSLYPGNTVTDKQCDPATASGPQALYSAQNITSEQSCIGDNGCQSLVSSDRSKLHVIKPNNSKSSGSFCSAAEDKSSSEVVQVVVFDEKTGMLESEQVTLDDVMNECLQAGKTWVVLPVNDIQRRHTIYTQNTNKLLNIAAQVLLDA